jgi:hypothetical protein
MYLFHGVHPKKITVPALILTLLFTALAGSHEKDFYLIKTDDSGGLLWNRTYHPPYPFALQNYQRCFVSIATTKDGGYILAGRDSVCAWLIETDSEGNEQWNHHYDPSGNSARVFSVAVELADGCYVVLEGSTVVVMDSFGNLLWSATCGTGYKDGVHSVVTTEDGGFVVAGSLNINVWLAKFASEASSTFPNLWVVVTTVAVISVAVIVYLWRKK